MSRPEDPGGELAGTDIQTFSNQVRHMEYRPRVHGNGFIQLDLTPTKRLHIWGHPDIPKQVSSTQVHNHQFDFTSRVITGKMINRMYTWDLLPEIMDVRDDAAYLHLHLATHQIYRAVVRDREDTVLQPTGEYGVLRVDHDESFTAGHSYTMQRGDLHESIPVGLTATIIDKTGPTLSQGGPQPNVYVPISVLPDNEFNRYGIAQETLWRIIADVLQYGMV